MLIHGGLLCIAFCLSVRPSVCLWLDKKYWTIIHNSKSIAPMVTKFGQDMGVGDPMVDLEGQGHRSKVKVTGKKKRHFGCHLTALQVIFEVKVHIGQGQRSIYIY